MLASKSSSYSQGNLQAFYAFGGIVLSVILIAMYTQNFLILGLPLAILGTVAVIKDYSLLYYGFWAVLPFSIEFGFGSLGTDLPTEPIMLLLTGVGVLLFLKNIHSIDYSIAFRGVGLLLVLHVFWTFFSSIFSQSPIVSFKFFLAKVWYVIPFFFMTFHFVKKKQDLEKLVKTITLFLSFAILIVLTRHALKGFTFAASHEVVRPIFRNHVNYSAILVLVIPYVWALWRNNLGKTWGKVAMVALLIYVFGIYFSYTRAAQLCLVVGVGCYFLFKFRLAKLAIISSLIGAVLLVSSLVKDNTYMDYAPNFERTVAHYEFDNLLAATYKMEDISTMERVYRWVAGGYMTAERPYIGFGPGSFYNHYTKFVVSSFETYVSDNPEKSGIHSYYLMVLVEQGFIGLLIFLTLVFGIILTGEQFINSVNDPARRNYLYAATISTVIICVMCIINDLIEADKVGPFFFMNAAVILILGKKESLTDREIVG